METEQPIPRGRGFENLPLSAQALWFHLAVNADEEGRISCTAATRTRENIGASEADAKALLVNQFVASAGGGQLQVERNVTYPGLVTEISGEEVMITLFHRVEIWRQSVAAYEKQCCERERRYAEPCQEW